MKKMIKRNKICFLIFLFSILLAAAVFPFLESRIPIHWNMAGEIDGYGSRLWIFTEPLMMLFLTILLDVTRNIDPKRANYVKFEKNFDGIKAAVCLLLLLVQLITTAVCLGIDVQVQIVLPILIGILFIYIGNMMPKFKHNYFVGIKTPWTLADPEIWFQTHRFKSMVRRRIFHHFVRIPSFSIESGRPAGCHFDPLFCSVYLFLLYLPQR